YSGAFAYSLFPYPLSHRSALRPAYPEGGRGAYPVPLPCPSGLGLPFPPGALATATRDAVPLVPGYAPVGSSLSAPWACCTSRRLSGILLCCPSHSTLALFCDGACRHGVLSRLQREPMATATLARKL